MNETIDLRAENERLRGLLSELVEVSPVVFKYPYKSVSYAEPRGFTMIAQLYTLMIARGGTLCRRWGVNRMNFIESEENQVSTSEVIKTERNKLGWTQRQLANRSGISIDRLRLIEDGNEPTIRERIQLGTCLDIMWTGFDVS